MSGWQKLMTRTRLSNFDRWDFAESALQPSPLYALNPRGLGTPLVESLGSYVIRLAEAHVVSVWRLIIHVLSPPRPCRISRSTLRYAYPANGLGKVSNPLLRALEVGTQRRDLCRLTLSALEGCIAQPGTFRTAEAWCPGCLEQWRAAGVPLYTPLLWALQSVTMCPIHKCPLGDRCPHCHSRFAPLRARALPGRCSICLEPLGTSEVPTIAASPEEQPYELWVAEAIGHLLAELPNLQQLDMAAALRDNLYRCLNQTEGATREYLSMIAGASPCAFRLWATGESKPTLDHLCRLSYRLKLPLITLFQGIPAKWRGPVRLPGNLENLGIKYCSQPAMERSELRAVLVASLSENPPRSVAEISRRLRFRRPQTLWSREPELCKQIARRRRDSGMIVRPATQLYPRSQGQHLEGILREHLAEQDPLSLNEIASRLGYKGSGAIRERFSDLCRAITAKRKQQVLRKREGMRVAIETARTEIAPPSLREIGRRLGYTVEFVVVKTFPELCALYKGWRRSWFEERRNKLRLSIREWVAAETAPTVSSVCCHFGLSQSYFQVNFPEDNKELVRRSAERVRRARADSARELHEEVIRIVCDLQKKGIYPSLPRVRSELRPGSTRYFPLIRTAVDEAMSSFGPIMRQRNELGRFV